MPVGFHSTSWNIIIISSKGIQKIKDETLLFFVKMCLFCSSLLREPSQILTNSKQKYGDIIVDRFPSFYKQYWT
jgi:hypothetical protein